MAEGLFAPDLVAPLRERGLLLDAVVLYRAPWKNFVRRLARDLSERRKPPVTLVRRGWGLMRCERELLQHQLALGCRALDRRAAGAVLAAARSATAQS